MPSDGWLRLYEPDAIADLARRLCLVLIALGKECEKITAIGLSGLELANPIIVSRRVQLSSQRIEIEQFDIVAIAHLCRRALDPDELG